MDSELIFELVSSSPEETEKAGAEFAGMINGEKFPGFPCVIALCGDLGAGKTVFVRGMASVLCPGARVRSSTYTVV
ncbi:MAG: tRNA (adenosine(37)-N6)-threonylcarbamoyltransferase complex ATPase subunit type 1 TsaE, partial [Clostridia bacterium]|nr:tRNA (adenosine(37)-N6)-threonylcarbamoyltransferase complex ATPase subunit type 1 TsaE [Clostridia bacterium]